jgi:hypothetical protein
MRVATIQHLEEWPHPYLLGLLQPSESVIINKGHMPHPYLLGLIHPSESVIINKDHMPHPYLLGLIHPSESVIINKDHIIRFSTNHIQTALHTVGMGVMRITEMSPTTMMKMRREKQ